MFDDHLNDSNMPTDLREVAAKIADGADPDAVPGVERLWIYRAERDFTTISAAQSEFFDELRRRHAAGEKVT